MLWILKQRKTVIVIKKIPERSLPEWSFWLGILNKIKHHFTDKTNKGGNLFIFSAFFLITFVTNVKPTRHIGMTGFDDIHYVRLIKDGDTNAFVHIVRRYQRMVFTIVSKIVINTEDAEDITQEIFIKIYQSLSKFRGDSEFSTWLYRIAYNTAITEVRKTKREFLSFEDMAERIPDHDIADHIEETSAEERLQYLDLVLKQLNPEDAFLITLFYLNNHSVQDISQVAGLSVSNVKVKLHRIRKFMNSEINKLISK